MDCSIEVLASGNVTLGNGDALVIPFFDDVDLGWGKACGEDVGKMLDNLKSRDVLPKKAGESYWLATPGGACAGVFVATLGSFEDFSAETMRRAGGSMSTALRANKIERVVLDATQGEALPVEALLEGVLLGGYTFTAHKSKDENGLSLSPDFVVITDDAESAEYIREGCAREAVVCAATNWARDLANTPGSTLPPRVLADHAEALAKEHGLKCTIFDEVELEKRGLNGILSVGKGSAEKPRLIFLEYTHPEAQRTLALVGKGITFDTGGISLKPSAGMHEMKFDMGGAAAVIGAMRAIATLKPKMRVIMAIPSAENKPSAEAYLPGDVITMYDGQKVEVQNTDAEGRMVLADALAFVEEEYKPDAIVEASTLTGACVVALGSYAAGLMTRDDDLSDQLELAAAASGDRVWPLPLWDDYDKMLDHGTGDFSNIAQEREAGTSVAGCFLNRFVKNTPYAHVDIAGAAWSVKKISYLDSTLATGFGVRLFTQWVLDESPEEE